MESGAISMLWCACLSDDSCPKAFKIWNKFPAIRSLCILCTLEKCQILQPTPHVAHWRLLPRTGKPNMCLCWGNGPPVFATPAKVPLVTVQWLQAGHQTIRKTSMSSMISFNNSLNPYLVSIVCSCTNWILYDLVRTCASLCLPLSPCPSVLSLDPVSRSSCLWGVM